MLPTPGDRPRASRVPGADQPNTPRRPATPSPGRAPRPDRTGRSAAAVAAPNAASRSRHGQPHASGTVMSTPARWATCSRCGETASSRPAITRSQPRTVAAGTFSAAPIERWPCPAARASSAAPITSAAYARRSNTVTGSSTCVTRHPPQRARRGRTRCWRPPRPRSHRPRAQPHPPSTPPTPRAGQPTRGKRLLDPGGGRSLPSAPVRLAPPARPSRTVGPDGEGLARSRRTRACCPPQQKPTPTRGRNPSLSSSPPSLPPQAPYNPNTRVAYHRAVCPASTEASIGWLKGRAGGVWAENAPSGATTVRTGSWARNGHHLTTPGGGRESAAAAGPAGRHGWSCCTAVSGPVTGCSGCRPGSRDVTINGWQQTLWQCRRQGSWMTLDRQLLARTLGELQGHPAPGRGPAGRVGAGGGGDQDGGRGGWHRPDLGP